MKKKLVVLAAVVFVIAMIVPAAGIAVAEPGGAATPGVSSSGGSWVDGTTTPSKTWYFSQCPNSGGYETWLTVANTSSSKANVSVAYITADGLREESRFSVDPGKSQSVMVGDTVNREAFAEVTSTQPVIASRTISNSEYVETNLGSPTLSKTFFFAEGSTRDGFQEYLGLSNFSSNAASCTVKYYLGSGLTQDRNYTVPALTRVSIDVNGDIGANEDVCTRITSDRPILAERTVFIDHRGLGAVAMDNTVGATSTSTTWSFAPGTTQSNFDEWLILWNMGNSQADVVATYCLADGTTVSQAITVAPASRNCISVNQAIGDKNCYGLRLESTKPIVCERATYWNYSSPVMKGDCKGGSILLGSNASPKPFYIPGARLGPNCEEWINIANFEVSAAEVTLKAYTSAGTKTKTYTVPAMGSKKVILNKELLSSGDIYYTEVTSNGSVLVQGAIFYTAEAPTPPPVSQTWYFAEGTCRPMFDPWFCLINTDTANDAEIKMTFMLGDGSLEEDIISVPASARMTISPKAYLGEGDDVAHDFSTKFEGLNGVGFVAERSEYFKYKGEWGGGHAVVGATQLSDTFYFSEGTCRSGFDPFICIQNPDENAADIKIEYMMGDGTQQEQTLTVGATSRRTVTVKDFLGEGPYDFSAKVISTNGVEVLAERLMYFSYSDGQWNCSGGHAVIGATSLSDAFYFAEGTCRPGFDPWLCLLNSSDDPIDVEITYMLADGSVEAQTATLVPHSRYTTSPKHLLGEGDIDFSTKVESTNGAKFLVERPVYFSFGNGYNGGHNVIGSPSLLSTFYFAEGCTMVEADGRGFEEYLCIQNASDSPAEVTITYLMSGLREVKTLTIGPHSRETRIVASDVGEEWSVSAVVESNRPVLAERIMYFNYGERLNTNASNNAPTVGGHAVIGYTP